MSNPAGEEELQQLRVLMLGVQSGVTDLAKTFLQMLVTVIAAETNKFYTENQRLQQAANPHLSSSQEPPKNTPRP